LKRDFNKTSCAVADQFDKPCKVHDLGKTTPQNLAVLDELGYKFELWNNKILLEQASVGDLNLIRYITESLPYTKKITTILNRISSVEKRNYELTSGWLSWSNNDPCPIKCNYCVMSMIDYLSDRKPVGCHPKDLLNLTIDNTPSETIVDDIIPKELYISYKDCRVQQDCIKY